jgi:hypothetical protein
VIRDWADYGITGSVHTGNPTRALPYRAKLARRISRALNDLRRLDASTSGRFYSALSLVPTRWSLIT